MTDNRCTTCNRKLTADGRCTKCVPDDPQDTLKPRRWNLCQYENPDGAGCQVPASCGDRIGVHLPILCAVHGAWSEARHDGKDFSAWLQHWLAQFPETGCRYQPFPGIFTHHRFVVELCTGRMLWDHRPAEVCPDKPWLFRLAASQAEPIVEHDLSPSRAQTEQELQQHRDHISHVLAAEQQKRAEAEERLYGLLRASIVV